MAKKRKLMDIEYDDAIKPSKSMKKWKWALERIATSVVQTNKQFDNYLNFELFLRDEKIGEAEEVLKNRMRKTLSKLVLKEIIERYFKTEMISILNGNESIQHL